MEFYADEIDRDLMVLVADGGLNSDTAEGFLEGIEKLVDAGVTKVIVDCAKLEYVSSYGLGVLIRLHKRMKRRGGDVKLCNIRGAVPQALQATRLNQLLGIYPDVNRARLSFRPKDAPGLDDRAADGTEIATS